MVEADQSEDLEFKWCKKKGVGGKNKEIQFYESFRFDGVDYSLYDSVYLYKEGEPEPYIGKLVKLWENPNKTKKAKVLWFFRPCEIQKYLENEEVHENELFLASGEGAGLANINPLDAIAGKCDVICISTDERNRKPVDEELRMAEFVFHRTFDVGQQKISDKIDEQIAGIEAKHLLNRAAIYKFDGTTKDNPIDEGNEEGGKNTIARDSPTPRITKSAEGKPKDEGVSIIKESLNLPLAKDKCPHDKTNSRVVANVSAVDGRASTTTDNMIANDRKLKKSQGFGNDDRPMKRPKLDDKLPKREDKDYKNSSMANTCIENDEKDKNHVQTSAANVDRIGKSRQSIDVPKDKSKLANKSEWLDKDPCKPKVEGKSSLSNTALERSDNLPNGDETNHYKVIEVARRPNLDKKTWFKKLPFDEEIGSAFRKGTLVLLLNLDPLFTSSEVEDIIWHAFKEDCTARMIQQTAISGRHSGRAFVIFQTREAAEKVLRKLDEDCLLLSSSGRPIVASPPDLSFISKEPTFHGHLVFNNLRQSSNREMKETVSTSHCAQSNTVEYEMALEWSLLHDRHDYAWNHMHKQHGVELRKLKAGFKGK